METYNVFLPKTQFIMIIHLCLIFDFWLVLCVDFCLWTADFCLWTVRIFCLWTVLIFGTLLASLVAGASRPQGSLREPVAAQTRYRFPRSPTL